MDDVSLFFALLVVGTVIFVLALYRKTAGLSLFSALTWFALSYISMDAETLTAYAIAAGYIFLIAGIVMILNTFYLAFEYLAQAAEGSKQKQSEDEQALEEEVT